MDPHAVLGVSADADDEAINRAYRNLAKQYHPDHHHGDDEYGPKMAEINAAYALLRDTQAEMLSRGPKPAPATRPTATKRRPAGAWLSPEVRRALGRELLASLLQDEEVHVVTDAATWDSPNTRLAVTDRRILWLRADLPTDRVRYLRWSQITKIDGRLKRPRRRVGELLVQPRAGKRVSFSELEPSALQLVLLSARKHVPA